MAEVIEHQGVITEINQNSAKARIVQMSACSTCTASGACMAADSKEKIIDVLPLDDLKVGDEVQITVERRLGFVAVLFAFVLPFSLVILLVAILTKITSLSDGLIGTIALLALVPYYLILSLFKDRFKKKFSFYARKLTNINN